MIRLCSFPQLDGIFFFFSSFTSLFWSYNLQLELFQLIPTTLINIATQTYFGLVEELMQDI